MTKQTPGPSILSFKGRRGRGGFPAPFTILLLLFLFGCQGNDNPTLPSLPADVTNVSNDKTFSIAPAAAASGNQLYVAWADQGNAQTFDIFLSRSANGGTDFDPPLNISQSNDSSLNPRIALSGSTVYLVWEEFISAKNESDILFRKGEDQGGVWVWTPPLDQAAINLSASATPCKDETNAAAPAPCPSQFPDIAVEGTRIFVAWAEENDYTITIAGAATDFKIINSDIQMAVSQDGGTTFTPPFNASGNKSAICITGATLTPSVSPTLAAANGHLYLAWEDCVHDNPAGKVVFRRFEDSGNVATPSQGPIALSDPFKNASRPSLAAQGDQVYAVWEEFFVRDVPPGVSCTTTDVLFNASAQKGTDFSAVNGPAAVNLSNTPCGFNASSAKLAASGPFVYVAWQDNFPGNTGISLKRSVDGGVHFGDRENLSQTSGSAGTPALAPVEGLLNAFWEDSTLGNLEILFARR